MAGLPIFDETPILKPQAVSSGAQGFTQLAQLFGEVAKTGTEIAGRALESESRAHLYNATATAQQIKNDYELSLKANPDPIAGEVALQAMGDSLTDLTKNSYVNKADRMLLQKDRKSVV